MVTISYTHCDHKVQLECYRKGHKTCPQPCPFRLECGHACTRTCHVLDDPDHLETEDKTILAERKTCYDLNLNQAKQAEATQKFPNRATSVKQSGR
ncbi:hypothetical protein J6590_058156 [Homalodisca vitripennis]|nr:hypothetical protein J6590_058156 [Homalodisca vitripennis]